MSLVVAFSADGGAVDVSRAYIPEEKWDEAISMRRYRDAQLEEVGIIGRFFSAAQWLTLPTGPQQNKDQKKRRPS